MVADAAPWFDQFAFCEKPTGCVEQGFRRVAESTLQTRAENGMSILLRFWRDEAAATAIEYAIIAVGVSVVIVATVNSIGTSVKGLFTNVSTSLGNAGK
jgi:pilus assembly protein Flp/PilA